MNGIAQILKIPAFKILTIAGLLLFTLIQSLTGLLMTVDVDVEDEIHVFCGIGMVAFLLLHLVQQWGWFRRQFQSVFRL